MLLLSILPALLRRLLLNFNFIMAHFSLNTCFWQVHLPEISIHTTLFNQNPGMLWLFRYVLFEYFEQNLSLYEALLFAEKFINFLFIGIQ